MRRQGILNIPQCFNVPFRIGTHHIVSLFFVFDWNLLPIRYHMKRLNIIFISQTLNTTYTRNLALARSTVKYHQMWNLGVICATQWKIMRQWESFTKENIWCWLTLPLKQLWLSLCNSGKKKDYHLPHVTTLGRNHWVKIRCGAFQRRHMFMDVKRVHDYAKHIYFQFCNQIK